MQNYSDTDHISRHGEEWTRFVNGDSCSFKQLFRKFYKGLYGYGLKLCNDPALVEDCIQELFESIWARRGELTHIDSPTVYLFVSLRRNILRHRKKQNRVKNVEGAIDESFQIHFGAEELIIHNEAKEQQLEELQKALNHLSNRQKEVIYLHFYNGMSYGEIEKILLINRQSVRNHMYRAVETLRTVMETDVMRLVIAFLISFIFPMEFFL